MKFGGDIVSVSEAMATSTGLAARTANRGNAENGWKIVAPGVTADGTVNSTAMNAQRYYTSMSGMAEEFGRSNVYWKASSPETLVGRPCLLTIILPFSSRLYRFLA